MSYSENDYQRERAICNKAESYRQSITQNKRNWISAEESQHPDYAACDNAMRGRVEQFEILRDLPEKFTAYLETGAADNAGANLAVIVWTGDTLGRAWVYTVGKRRSMSGDRQRYGRARIGGKLYAWQGPGAGMYAHFRAIKEQS
jgi:hypothetical protein